MRSTIHIHLKLYSILREKLPPDSKGQTVLQMKKGAVIADLLDELNIIGKAVISVNDVHESDMSRQLQDGDKVQIFSSISGG